MVKKRRSPRSRSPKSRSPRSRSPKSRRLSPYQKFVKAHMGKPGTKTMAQVAKKWNRCH